MRPWKRRLSDDERSVLLSGVLLRHPELHLPEGWHREHAWLNLWEAACGPPAAAA